LRSEMESLAVAKAEADNLAARGIQQGELNAAERAKVQEAIAEQALTALRAELAAMTVELEAARADTATACRQRDAMRIALRRAGAKRTPVHAELEAARAQAALTEYWRNRYEGLRARMRGILERFGIIWLARLAPSPIRHFIRERMFGPGRA
ncbi:MAG: hypothetical protein M3069_07395, partial [Chloroflexota bacterium]|nr:hypothetical protein [Chloroflexota bacterium]